MSVKANQSLCQEVGEIVKGFQINPEFFDREFVSMKVPEETKFRAYLYSLAICHQTHTLYNQLLNKKGWDYLEYAFSKLAQEDSKLLDPEFLSKLSEQELSDKLRVVFADDGNPKTCTLDRLEERSRFLIDIAKKLVDEFDGQVGNLLAKSESQLINNGYGIYELLADFEAYSDPMKKKSTCFIKMMSDAGIFEAIDPENIVPVMDYHMQRTLMRLGCVEILDDKLREKLINQAELDSDEEIRSACVEAMKMISKASGYQITKMDDFFWSFGRSCCKEKKLCIDGECNKSPCTFTRVVFAGDHTKCVFEDVCLGRHDEKYRDLWQPNVRTHYY